MEKGLCVPVRKKKKKKKTLISTAVQILEQILLLTVIAVFTFFGFYYIKKALCLYCLKQIYILMPHIISQVVTILGQCVGV